jgi:DNA repair protein RadC
MKGKPHLRIKLWAENDRPREKLIQHGKLTLSDAELIAILLRSGSVDETAVDLAKQLLASVENSLPELGKLDMGELTRFRGIGDVKAITLIAALELGRRRRESDVLQKKTLQNSEEVFHYMEPLLSELKHEEFWVVYLNRSNRILKRENVSKGGVSGTIADTRMIYKTAIEVLASGIVLCHNHPSGSPKPSKADIQLTRRLSEAGRVLEIPVLDHLIITDKIYYSFADEGAL